MLKPVSPDTSNPAPSVSAATLMRERRARWLPGSEQDLRLFTAALLWMSTTLTVEAASFVPVLAPENVNFWRLSMGIPAMLWAVTHLTLAKRWSVPAQDRFLAISVALGAPVNMVLMNITNATWAIVMNAISTVIWAAYFLKIRGALAITGMTAVVVLAPLYINLEGAAGTDLSRLVVFLPALFALAAGLHIQKRMVDRAMARVDELAYRDPLTGMGNRRFLLESFERLTAEREPAGLLLIDLDDFKRANTLYGHLGGDHALRHVSRQLQRSAPSDNVVARIGGDEFVVLMPGASATHTEEMAQFYRGAVSAANSELGLEGVVVDAAVGVANCPSDGDTLDDLLTVADESMYREKAKHARDADMPDVKSVDIPAWLAAAETTIAEPAQAAQTAPHRTTALLGHWRSRTLFARFAFLLWVGSSSMIALALAMPGADHSHFAAAITGCAIGMAIGVAILFTNPRSRGFAHAVIDIASLLALATITYLTGGSLSPAIPVICVFAVYQAWFMRVRTVGWRILGPALVIASPLLYDDVFRQAGWEISAAFLYSANAITITLVSALTISKAVLTGVRRRARELALTDPLTELPNRHAFSDRMEIDLAKLVDAKGDDAQMAVVMIDLDNFKAVNTKHGHRAGDQLLATIGTALAVVARSSDCVARVGGDEFAALLPNAGVDAARTLAERFVSAVSISTEPFARESGIHVTASAGFALCPLHGTTLDELMRAADDALMSMKREGKGGARVSNVVTGV